MNRYQLYTLGGALLAATSLASAAQAGTVGAFASRTAGTNAFTAGAVKLTNTALSTTATTANAQIFGGGARIGFSFTNSFDRTFNLNIAAPLVGSSGTPTMVTTSPTVVFMLRDTGNNSSGTFAASAGAGTLNVAGTTTSVSVLASQLFISNAQISLGTGTTFTGLATASAQIGGIALQSIQFTNASGLATAGATISLGATLSQQGNSTLVYETIASAAAVTSTAPLTVSVSAGTAGVVNANSSPTLFTNFSTGGGTSGLTVTLATISITANGAVSTDLTTPVVSDSQVANTVAGTLSMSVTLSSPALTDAALSSTAGLAVTSGPGASTINGLTSFTASAFSSGSVTFTLTAAAATYTTSVNINLQYNGTTAISAAAAGTATVTFAAGGASTIAPGGASGATAAISRGGLTTEINWANNGASQYASYVRIHNKGTSASTASITVKNSATGTQLGTTTYTTPSVPAGGTIQVAVSTIETALSLTPSGAYDLAITGAFPGYVQHIVFNGVTGAFTDLSGYRNAGSSGSAP